MGMVVLIRKYFASARPDLLVGWIWSEYVESIFGFGLMDCPNRIGPDDHPNMTLGGKNHLYFVVSKCR